MWGAERERERERNCRCWFILQMFIKPGGWVRLKSGARDSIWFSQVGDKSLGAGAIICFPGCASSGLDPKQRSWHGEPPVLLFINKGPSFISSMNRCSKRNLSVNIDVNIIHSRWEVQTLKTWISWRTECNMSTWHSIVELEKWIKVKKVWFPQRIQVWSAAHRMSSFFQMCESDDAS